MVLPKNISNKIYGNFNFVSYQNYKIVEYSEIYFNCDVTYEHSKKNGNMDFEISETDIFVET